MKRQKVTVASLAKDLELSTCTVSKILTRSLNGFSYTPETIRRVDAMAKLRGYVPNVHARSLRTRKSMTIGLVVPSGIPYFSGTLVENIERELRPLGYETIVGHSTGEAELEAKLLITMMGKGVDGILWIPNGKTLRLSHLGITPDFPAVLLDRPGCSVSFPTVITDNEGASEELAHRIQQAGYKSLTMLSSPVHDDDSITEREAGIRKVFGARITLLESANDIEEASRAVETAASTLQGGVLVCLAQNLALGALNALILKNQTIGADVGFASFDDLPLCEIWQPSITRIQQNLDLLAQEAVRLLLEKIRTPDRKQPSEVRIPARLVWGKTIPELKK